MITGINMRNPLKRTGKKKLPMPGIEPGPRGWKPRILTTRPHGRTLSALAERAKHIHGTAREGRRERGKGFQTPLTNVSVIIRIKRGGYSRYEITKLRLSHSLGTPRSFHESFSAGFYYIVCWPTVFIIWKSGKRLHSRKQSKTSGMAEWNELWCARVR